MTYLEQLRAEQARVVTTPREYMSKEEYAKHKGALTRARNSGDPAKVLVAVERAVERFNETIWPDNWPMWRVALLDAASEARRAYNDDLAEELRAAALILFRL